MTRDLMTLFLADETATCRLGQALAGLLRSGDVVLLDGDLGTGKSTLCRALIRAALGDPDEEVPSPTFTLVQVYDGETASYWHFDLYRLENPDDALELGIEDAFADGVSLIEWPQRLGPWAPRRALTLSLTHVPEGGRRVTLQGDAPWAPRLATLANPS